MRFENEFKNKKRKNGGFNMIKTMKKQLENEKGLTLIELLAVIVILAIIAAIAIPAIGNIITNSKYSAVKSDAINVINAGQLYYLDNPEGETNPDTTTKVTVSELKNAGYLDNPGTIPGNASISRETPNKLTTETPAKFDNKDVNFINATIEIINEDPRKGKDDGPFKIGG